MTQPVTQRNSTLTMPSPHCQGVHRGTNACLNSVGSMAISKQPNISEMPVPSKLQILSFLLFVSRLCSLLIEEATNLNCVSVKWDRPRQYLHS